MLLEGNKMTITAYYPIYLRRDIEAALKQYTEELGFELLHTVEDGVVKAYVLGLGSYRIEIVNLDRDFLRDKPDGFLATRVNVREMEEALAYFQSKGYKPFAGVIEETSFHFAPLMNDAGEIIFLSHHLRQDERETN